MFTLKSYDPQIPCTNTKLLVIKYLTSLLHVETLEFLLGRYVIIKYHSYQWVTHPLSQHTIYHFRNRN